MKGILKANYKETPFDEFFPLNSVAIPQPRYPNTKEHPSLLFKKENAHLIRSRFYREPYKSWGENIIERALTNNHDLTSPLLYELWRSEGAKANAFAYFLTLDNEFLETAISALLNIGDTLPPISPEGQNDRVGWGDWMRAAQALRNFAVSYDLIYWELSAQQREIIENKMMKQVEQHHRNFRKFPRNLNKVEISSGIGIPKNNHITEIAAGVATVTLVIDDSRCKKYFYDAIRELQYGLAMIDVDGSYREGANYGRFVASIIFPLAHYIKNITNTNILNSPRIKKFTRWLIDMEKPDGTIPLFDDAYSMFFPFQPLGSGLTNYEHELFYLFEKNAENFRDNDLMFIDAFCGFDDRTFPQAPNYDPATFYPDGGMSIFRGDRDIYALLLGEPGRKNYSHHDHFEPGAITLSAYNKDFLIDSGYGIIGPYDLDRSWFTSAQAHNIPLVNGLGPNLNPVWGDDLDAEMGNYFGSEQISASQVRSNYRGADLTRSIWFANQRYFIVVDEFISNRKKRFSIPWHGLGIFEKVRSTSARWTQDNYILDAEFISENDNSLLFTTKTGLHTNRIFNYEHQILEAKLPPSKQNKFISVFIPNMVGEEEVQADVTEAFSNSNINARVIIDRANNWKDFIVLADSVWNCENVSSDANIAVFHQNEFNAVEYLSANSVTYFTIDDEVIFRADKPIDITIHLSYENWFGHISSKQKKNNFIEFFPTNNQGFMSFNNKIVEFDDSICRFVITESGVFDFHPSRNKIDTADKFKPNYPILNSLNFSQDPNYDIELMNNFEKNQLRNEITMLTSKAMRNEVDSLINYPLKNIYGITAGLVNAAWSSSESFKINLPQSFELEREIAGKQVSYFEEGHITDKGLSTNFHRLEIEDTFYFLQESYFRDHHFTSAEINFRQYHIYADREELKNDIDYQFAFDRFFDNGTIALQHNSEEKNESRNGILLNYNTWNSQALWNQTDEKSDYYFSLSKQGKRFSGNFAGNFSEDNKLQNFLFTNSLLISSNLLFNSRFIRAELDGEKTQFVDSNIYYYISNFSGSFSTYKTLSEKYKYNWRMKYNYYKFGFVHHGEFQKHMFGDFELRYKGRKISIKNTLHKLETNQFKIAFNSKKNWSVNTGLELDLVSSKLSRISGGLHFNKFIRSGLDVMHTLNNEKEWLGICWVMDSRIFKNELLNIYTATFFDDQMDVSFYEIQISQIGKNYSPGIKIKKDNRGFVTGEGYVSWEF